MYKKIERNHSQESSFRWRLAWCASSLGDLSSLMSGNYLLKLLSCQNNLQSPIPAEKLSNLRWFWQIWGETFSYYFGEGLFVTISRRHFHIFSDLRLDSPSFIIPLLLKNFVQSRQNKGVTSLTNGQNLAAKSVSHEGLFLELISDIR